MTDTPRPDLKIKLHRRGGIVRLMRTGRCRRLLTVPDIFAALADLEVGAFDSAEIFFADDDAEKKSRKPQAAGLPADDGANGKARADNYRQSRPGGQWGAR